MKKLFLSLLMLTFLSLPAISNPGEPKGFLGKVYNNSLALYATYNKKNYFDCSAAVYEKIKGGYYLITAGHCVQGVPENATFSVADQIGGSLTPVKLLKAREDDIDFAQFELRTDKSYPVIEIGDEDTLRVGDEVINSNFADGLGKQLSIGRVSTQNLIKTRDCVTGCEGGFLVQIYGAGGSSGSVVISKKTHKIVGIVLWGFDGDLPVGMGIEPISRFKLFLTLPTQPHPTPSIPDELKDIMQIILGEK